MTSDNTSDDSGKTKRLDDDYFKEIARKAQGQNFDEDKTQLVTRNRGADQATSTKAVSDDNRTRVYRDGNSQGGGSQGVTSPVASGNMDDPPVGWLVATEGPGKGAVLTLGIGMNTVGRGDEPRITIPFSDDEISRGKSFSVAYDEKNRQFYLLPGEGKTLVYVDGQPVLQQVVMTPHLNFRIGQTTFLFVPLCNAEFDWNGE